MPDEADALESLRHFVSREVRAGFTPAEELVDYITLIFKDEVESGQLAGLIEPTVGQELERHRREQATWPEVTDCDRLDAAFAELEESGILARQNFWCCPPCGVSAIQHELHELDAQGTPARGYTFYHEQSTEAAVEGEGICLSYGCAQGDEVDDVAIGHEVVAVLRRQGLNVRWNGSIEQTIEVDLDWKRRRPET